MRIEDFSTTVIRAVPVDITLSAVKHVEPTNPAEIEHWEPDEGEEVVGLVLTAGVFDEIARKWGDLDTWMEAIAGKIEEQDDPARPGKKIEVMIEAPKNSLGAIIDTLAIALHRHPTAVGAALSMQAIPEYSAALMAAMQIAQGVDPMLALRIGKRIASARPDPNAGLEDRLNQMDGEEATSLSTLGAGTGPSPVETSTPSGP